MKLSIYSMQDPEPGVFGIQMSLVVDVRSPVKQTDTLPPCLLHEPSAIAANCPGTTKEGGLQKGGAQHLIHLACLSCFVYKLGFFGCKQQQEL